MSTGAQPRLFSDGGSRRIDGWKSIAAYFGRDRSTVIRWAQDRGLPVHRIPGGRTGTVYALSSELELWAQARVLTDAGLAEPGEPSTAISPGRPKRRWVIASAIGAVLLIFPPAAFHRAAMPAAAAASLPGKPAVAAKFLAARDLVAERDSAGIERAIALLESVTLSAPNYAPGHAALSEALILSREFGSRDDRDAFLRARIAARTAVRLEPTLAAGHRMLGFIAYWADGDIQEADLRFRRAIELAPTDAMSHFWYGNVLSDRGRNDEALQMLDRARLLQPGSVAIRTDLAWAHWAAGNETQATADLTAIAQRYPNFAVAQDCLAVIAFARGDLGGYVSHFEQFAVKRGDRHLLAQARDLRAAQSASPARIRQVLLHQSFADMQTVRERNRAWASFVAAKLHDRPMLLRTLSLALERGEQWGDAGIVNRLRGLTSSDDQVTQMLNKLTGS